MFWEVAIILSSKKPGKVSTDNYRNANLGIEKFNLQHSHKGGNHGRGRKGLHY